MSGPRVSFKVAGLEEYLEKIKKTGANMDKLVADAIDASAAPIEDTIYAWAEKHKRTGAVLEGVGRSEVQREGDKFFVEVGVFSGAASPTAWHAAFVEYGTPRMAPDPGIRPAFKKNQAKVKKIQRDILTKGGVPLD